MKSKLLLFKVTVYLVKIMEYESIFCSGHPA